MPIPKLCTERGCKHISRDGNPKCHLHRRLRNKPRAEVQERLTFYNTTRWKKFSKSIRSEHPVCELCNNELTSDCDHWLERSLDHNNNFEFDPRNMVCLCKACHYRKGSKIKRLVDAKDYKRIYHWLLSEHPRPNDSAYLHTWIKERTEAQRQGTETI